MIYTQDKLQSILGVRFYQPEILKQSLVHRSFLNERGGVPTDSYERLEFLGDAVLGLVVATELHRHCPDLSEGELTKNRIALVRRETLAEVARRLQLGEFLAMGRGEEATGGRARDSTLAAAFEAVVAAVYLDRGYEDACQFVLRVMADEMTKSYSLNKPPEDPKSCLQEYLQGMGRMSPQYRVLATEGPDHDPRFTVEVVSEEGVIGVGQGRRKTDAERAAARDGLSRLGVG